MASGKKPKNTGLAVSPSVDYPNLTGEGRPKGTKNKVTVVLKEAILLAAEEHGSDGEGKDGLKGYLSMVARADLKTFCGLLGRILPTQMDDDGAKTPIAGVVNISVIWPDGLEHRPDGGDQGQMARIPAPIVDTRPV
jgi:hypothetical protein